MKIKPYENKIQSCKTKVLENTYKVIEKGLTNIILANVYPGEIPTDVIGLTDVHYARKYFIVYNLLNEFRTSSKTILMSLFL